MTLNLTIKMAALVCACICYAGKGVLDCMGTRHMAQDFVKWLKEN